MGNGNNGSKGGNLLSRVAYSFGNVGQSAFYNALSTYFIVYVTSSLFSGVDKSVATKLIGIITGLVVVIRIAEIFIDPLLGNIIDNTNTKWGRFKPWQLIGGTVSAILLVLVYTGLFGLVNVNTTLFIVLFIITFIVLDVFYSLRDISYWGMIPALSSDSHERSTYTALGSFGGSIGYNGLTIVVIPIVTYFSWVFTGKYVESQSGWTCFAIIVAILGILTVCSVAFGTKESTTITGLEMFRKSLDFAEAGDNIGALLRGVDRTQIERGQVLAKPGTVHPHKVFESQVYVLTKDEGGRHTPFFSNYRPQFYFRTTDVTGIITLPEGTEMCMPGDNVQMHVELLTPVAMEEGLRFAIREGGRTVGSGVVGKIIE